tara:strand:- start:1339 stop:1545 length:207 start_codon:yes stop_codon:yes gene_type:complete
MEESLYEIISILLQENRPDLVNVIKKMGELLDEDYLTDDDTSDSESEEDLVNEELILKIDKDGFHSLD